jgi:hypothetical protein
VERGGLDKMAARRDWRIHRNAICGAGMGLGNSRRDICSCT